MSKKKDATATRFSLNDSQKQNKERTKRKIQKKKRPKGKTKISVQQSRNVRLATIVSPIDRRNDRTCSKKKKREFLSAPLSGTPLFPQTFHFYLRVSCFPPLPPLSFPFASLSSSPNFLFLHPFSTTFAYPAGAITTAGNKKVTERLRPVDANSREEDT